MTTLPAVVVALAYQTWADGARRRHSWSPDRMVQQLCADARVPAVTVVDPPRHPWRAWPRSLSDAGRPADLADGQLLRPWRLGRGEPFRARPARRVQRRVDGMLRRRVPAGDTVLVTCHPVLAAQARRDAWADVVYYGWDDWAAYPPFVRARGLIEDSYRAMATRDVHVVGVTTAVVERIGARRSTVVPNGVSAADLREEHSPPAWFSDPGGNVALYAGSLEERVDVDVLVELARDLPDWRLVLVGPMLRPDWFAPLAAVPNVDIRGVHTQPEVLAMARAASVCLVPHRDTPLTRGMSPLKLYEYLGVGTPVVATALSPMQRVSDRCLLVPPGRAWADPVRRAARLPPVGTEELEEFRRVHDWGARYEVWRAAVLGS